MSSWWVTQLRTVVGGFHAPPPQWPLPWMSAGGQRGRQPHREQLLRLHPGGFRGAPVQGTVHPVTSDHGGSWAVRSRLSYQVPKPLCSLWSPHSVPSGRLLLGPRPRLRAPVPGLQGRTHPNQLRGPSSHRPHHLRRGRQRRGSFLVSRTSRWAIPALGSPHLARSSVLMGGMNSSPLVRGLQTP